jgi:hypothetical protein
MPLQFIQETSGNAYIRFMVNDNEWLMSSAAGMEKIDMFSTAIIVDIENIQLGWLKLEGGRDWLPWPKNDPQQVAKPSDAHEQGFSVMFYSTKLFEDEPVRELSASGAGVRQFVQDLYEEAEKAKEFGSGKVPAIKISDAPKVKMGKNGSRVPQFEIVKWVNRPEALSGDVPQPEEKVAPPVSPAEKSGGAPNVDFNSEEI